jgi:hypothetical protein
MIKRSYTIQLDGEVTLGRFQRVLEAWHSTLEAISSDVDRNRSHRLLISDLSYGSAIAAVQIEFEREPVASEFEREFELIARQVRSNSIIELPRNLQKPARKLQEAASIDGGEGFTLSSDDADYMISPIASSDTVRPNAMPDNIEAIGAVKGKLQSLSSRGALKAVVFDELNDKAVRIALTEEQHDIVRDLWDEIVVVEGMIRRDPESGRPLSLTKVRQISRKSDPPEPFAWRKARGVLAHIHPEKTAEELIREARDA